MNPCGQDNDDRQPVFGAVYAMHGVTDVCLEGSFVHRNMMSRDTFLAFLAARPEPFVKLAAALAGQGEALTIDDATRAGLTAAQLARTHGHAVTLFVNGETVSEGLPHSFAILNALLDRASGSVSVGNSNHDLSTLRRKKTFRKYVRSLLRPLKTEEERLRWLGDLASLIGIDTPVLPAHLETVSVTDLRAAFADGIEIQNHGWSHTHFSCYTVEEGFENVARGRAWLSTECGVEANYFAVPYGDMLPQSGDTRGLYSCWLMLHDVLHAGSVGPFVHNRTEIQGPGGVR